MSCASGLLVWPGTQSCSGNRKAKSVGSERKPSGGPQSQSLVLACPALPKTGLSSRRLCWSGSSEGHFAHGDQGKKKKKKNSLETLMLPDATLPLHSLHCDSPISIHTTWTLTCLPHSMVSTQRAALEPSLLLCSSNSCQMLS